MAEHKTYRPIIYANHELNLPEMNWRCSVSVDTFNFSDETPYRVFWALEPEDISHIETKLIKNHEFYDLILTFNNNVLSACPNAVLFTNNGVWTKESDTSEKKFAVSFLTSGKEMCYGHRFRAGLYRALEGHIQIHRMPCLVKMHMSPPYLPDKRDMLVPFQYAISCQNSQQHNYFSEILLDCFATKTIPIFWGCANIGEFFNMDGILKFDDFNQLQNVFNSLSPDFYHSPRVQAAIEENYKKALTYEDRIGRLVKAIMDSWTPKITLVHSGAPNVEVPIGDVNVKC